MGQVDNHSQPVGLAHDISADVAQTIVVVRRRLIRAERVVNKVHQLYQADTTAV